MNKQYTDIMIDIETLDTKPTAVILSIGAVAFDIETGETCPDTLYQKLDYKKQIDEGRTTSIETTLWWGQQSDEAYCEAFFGEERLLSAIINLKKYFYNYAADDCRVWAKSPSFDLVILKDAYDNDIAPWEFWQERDVRTFADGQLTSVFVACDKEPSHLPVEDCLVQVKGVCLTYKGLREGKHGI